jgi:hypothetical protein
VTEAWPPRKKLEIVFAQAMKYLRCNWIHSNPHDPVVLYSELDDANWETRKVEVYADGHCGFASEAESSGDTRLGLEPVPPFDEIDSDPELELVEIQQAEFVQMWACTFLAGGAVRKMVAVGFDSADNFRLSAGVPTICQASG